METKHTKGEWKLQSTIAKAGLYQTYELNIDFNKNNTDCVTVYCSEETPTHEELANAKLIAAAPELLGALIEIHDKSIQPNFDIDDIDEIITISFKAIKKATK